MDKISNNFQLIILVFLIIFVTSFQVSRSSQKDIHESLKEKKDKIEEKKRELRKLMWKGNEDNEGNLKEIDQLLQEYKNLASEEINWRVLFKDKTRLTVSAVDLAILYRNKQAIELLLQYEVKPLYPEAMLIKPIENYYDNGKELEILAFLLEKGLKIDLNYKDDNQGFLTSVITNYEFCYYE